MSPTDTRTSDVEETVFKIVAHILGTENWEADTSFLYKALTSFREKAAADTAKAYGSCTKCYGKGYATTLQFTQSHEDFGGEKTNREQLPLIRYCSCDRGKQLKALNPPKETST